MPIFTGIQGLPNYAAPDISAAGLTVPTFTDIQGSLLSSYQSIYGLTAYLGNDAADYQWITAASLKLSDVMGLAQLVYNSRSPLTAIGSTLDSIVKINGIARLSPVLSTVTLVMSGSPGVTVYDGVVSDVNGILWSLPSTVVIGIGGTVSVTAVCQQNGAIAAYANTVIYPNGGFTAGWTSVTNPVEAVVGTIPEPDASLRARQSISVSLPSSTRLAATVAGISALSGVTRINVIENQTSVTDSYGNTGHSVSCVVEGGSDSAIATAIYINRGIGANTLGVTATAMTSVAVTDPNSGLVTNIGFVRPTYVPIFVSLTVHGLNSGFTTATQLAIKRAIFDYLQSLQIGESVTLSAIYGVALSVMPNLSRPLFTITALTVGLAIFPTGVVDIPIAFYEVAQGSTSNVLMTVVP